MGKIEARYGANITLLIEPFKQLVEKKLFPLLDLLTPPHPIRQDGAGDDTKRVFDQIRIAYAQVFNEKDVTRAARESAAVIDTTNIRGFRNQVQTVLGVDPLFSEPWLQDEIETFVHENSSLIKTIPAEHLSDIEQMVFREAKRGASPKEIKKKVQELFGVSDRAAARIARDQVSKFNGRLSELRQQAAGLTHYTWRTSEDGRVRTFGNSGGYSDHASLNGKVFSWKNPPVTVQKGKRAGETNHPGQDIECRCYPEPYFGKVKKEVKKKAAVGKKTRVKLTGLANVEVYEEILSTATTKQRAVINTLPKPEKILGHKGAGHYSPFNRELAADPNKRGGEVVLHEYGHHLDYEINRIFNKHGMMGFSEMDAGFNTAFLEDRKLQGFHRSATKGPAMKDFHERFYSKVEKTLSSGRAYVVSQINDEEGGGPGISDIIDAMTGGHFQNTHGGFGHGRKYYARQGSKQKETFANLFAIRSKNKAWATAVEIFPNLTKRFDEILAMVIPK